MVNKNLPLIAERIKSVRYKLGLSMEAFAERIGGNTKQGTVGNWETAKNAPNATRLKRIADLGHVSVDYLRGDTDDPGTNEWEDKFLANAAAFTAQQRELEQAYEALGKHITETASGADDDKLEKLAAIIDNADREIQALL